MNPFEDCTLPNDVILILKVTFLNNIYCWQQKEKKREYLIADVSNYKYNFNSCQKQRRTYLMLKLTKFITSVFIIHDILNDGVPYLKIHFSYRNKVSSVYKMFFTLYFYSKIFHRVIDVQVYIHICRYIVIYLYRYIERVFER